MPYICWNAAMPTTAAMAKVSTGTTIKTMLQLATPSTRMIRVISWGWNIDAVPGAAGQVELLQTDVAASVTAHVASGVQPMDPNAPASLLTLGASATGYTATAEGTPTATRSFDNCLIAPTAGAEDLDYDYQFLPEEQSYVAVSKFLRIRATFTTAVNMLCYVRFTEVG